LIQWINRPASHRVDRVERPVLPVADLLEHRVGDPADQVGRDLDAVELLQMAANLAHRHAARIERYDPVIPRVRPAAGPRTGYAVQPLCIGMEK
jgi:hypothetical protein